MTPLFVILASVLLLAQIVLPRRYAFVPMLFAVCHFGNVEIAGELTLTRLLILVGLLRAAIFNHIKLDLKNKIDVLFVLFAIIAMLSSIWHEDVDFNPFVQRAGLVYNVVGSYCYARAYLWGDERIYDLSFWLIIALTPLALSMLVEKHTRRNSYYVLGAASPTSPIRAGKVRATGPFRHPILAGTAGATALPLALGLYARRRKIAILGATVAFAITYASNSSGPLSALLASSCGLILWRWRLHLTMIRRYACAAILVIALAMERPIWYLMDYIDFTGGSTGWHRARLLEVAQIHLGEWWLAGTDYTRHWMPTGVTWNPDHTDLTNYYIHLGVLCGLPIIVILIAILFRAFGRLGECMRRARDKGGGDEWIMWCVGCSLVAHVLSMISISYFDQMYVLLYFAIASAAAFSGGGTVNAELAIINPSAASDAYSTT